MSFWRWAIGKNNSKAITEYMITHDFNKDFEYLVNRIFVQKTPTVFTRYGDGELALMVGKEIPSYSQACVQDKWTAPSKKTLLGKDLGNSLKNNDPEWFVGIPCDCCNPSAKNTYFYNLQELNVNVKNVTYANLFINGNYKKFKTFLNSIKEDVVVLANKEGKDKKYPFNVKQFISIEDDCVNFWQNEKDKFLEEIKQTVSNINETLFLISAGPMSEPIIDFLWSLNKTNRYIDIGSSLDEYTKGRITRPYMVESEEYSKRVCRMYLPKQKQNIAISLLTHNDIKYLAPCIESLLKSDILEHNIKLFCVDNNSTDETRKYLESINLEKKLIYNDTNEGIVIPRIKLHEEIKKENFDFLLELHADMVFPKKWINKLFSLDEDDVGILQPNIINATKIFSVEDLEEYIIKNGNRKVYDRCRQVHPWLIKLNKLDQIGGYYDKEFSPHECEDDDLVYRFLKNNLKIKTICDSIVVHYGGVTRHNVLPSCFSKNQQYFHNKHGVSVYDVVKLTQIHPAHQV